MTKTSTAKKAATSKGLTKRASNDSRLSGHTALRGISHSAQAKTIGVTDDLDDINSLYLRRKSQRNIALKNVIKQYELVKHSEWFLGTLKALNPDGYFPIDDFSDHVADIVEGDESSLDEAVDKLAVTQKRLHETIDAGNVSIGLQI